MTTPIEIDPKVVRVAAEAYKSKCRERDAGFSDCILAALTAAAPLLVAGEREACAKLVEDRELRWTTVQAIAAAIRQRGKQT
jgi:hypothetical protein